MGDRTLLSIEALFRYYSKRIIELPLRKASNTNTEIDQTKKIIRKESDEFAKQIRESSAKIQGYAKSHFREGMVSFKVFYASLADFDSLKFKSCPRDVGFSRLTRSRCRSLHY